MTTENDIEKSDAGMKQQGKTEKEKYLLGYRETFGDAVPPIQKFVMCAQTL